MDKNANNLKCWVLYLTNWINQGNENVKRQ